MFRKPFLVAFLLLLFLAPAEASLWERLSDLFKESQSTSFNQKELVKGLKEALVVSTKRAISFLGEAENLLKNKELRIPPPPKIAKITKFLKRVGLKSQVNAFEESLNLAAASAIKEAWPVFKEAISEITFEDAQRLLRGGDTAITDYFRAKTAPKLYEKFRPIVHQNLEKVGVTREYQKLITTPYAAPYFQNSKVDLDHYVTQAALERLFKVLAQEEIRLRKDPAARTTTLLKKLFGQS